MTRQVVMYQVVCDCCGRPATTSDYCAWTDDLGAQETASESGWLMDHEGKDYCWECHSYGDNDELVINESRRNTLATPNPQITVDDMLGWYTKPDRVAVLFRKMNAEVLNNQLNLLGYWTPADISKFKSDTVGLMKAWLDSYGKLK